MTGKKFLELSAIDVRDWLDKYDPRDIKQIVLEHWVKRRKILKWPTYMMRSHGDNDLEFCEIRIRYGEKYTIMNIEIIDGRKIITRQVKVYRGTYLISQYVRP